MKTGIAFVLGCALVVLAAPAAEAATLTFQYTFADSRTISGSLHGTLGADLDTFAVSSASNIVFNGTLLPIDPSDICSLNDFNSCAEQPTVSLSGSLANHNIFVCALGFDALGNCSFANDGGFFFGVFGAGAGDGLGNENFEPYIEANWSASITGVPEPATISLLITGLGLAGLVRRRIGKPTA